MPGYSPECVSGQHKACLEPECRCLCHPKVQNMVTKPATTARGALICPTCDYLPKLGDTFCRRDGARLIEGKLCLSGHSCDRNDIFCGTCGQKLDLAAITVTEFTEEEIAALEAKARTRPSDVEVPPTEVH